VRAGRRAGPGRAARVSRPGIACGPMKGLGIGREGGREGGAVCVCVCARVCVRACVGGWVGARARARLVVFVRMSHLKDPRIARVEDEDRLD
jgi:hypothetical protein